VVTSGHVTKMAVTRIVRSAISETPTCYTQAANLMALCFIEAEYMADRSYIHYGNIRIFDLVCSCDLDLDPMTFIYELDPYSLEIHRMYKYELRYAKAFESCCRTCI